MDWWRQAPKEAKDDLEASQGLGGNKKKNRAQVEYVTAHHWTLEGDARILKVLRARGFPVDEMVPMLVELQAGRFLTQRYGCRTWNPASGMYVNALKLSSDRTKVFVDVVSQKCEVQHFNPKLQDQ